MSKRTAPFILSAPLDAGVVSGNSGCDSDALMTTSKADLSEETTGKISFCQENEVHGDWTRRGESGSMTSAKTVTRSRAWPAWARPLFGISPDFSVAQLPRSINPLHDLFLHCAEGPYVADAVPGVGLARRTPDRFVAFEETRHEEFLRQRGQFD